jgi:hypothetical protein
MVIPVLSYLFQLGHKKTGCKQPVPFFRARQFPAGKSADLRVCFAWIAVCGTDAAEMPFTVPF